MDLCHTKTSIPCIFYVMYGYLILFYTIYLLQQELGSYGWCDVPILSNEIGVQSSTFCYIVTDGINTDAMNISLYMSYNTNCNYDMSLFLSLQLVDMRTDGGGLRIPDRWQRFIPTHLPIWYDVGNLDAALPGLLDHAVFDNGYIFITSLFSSDYFKLRLQLYTCSHKRTIHELDIPCLCDEYSHDKVLLVLQRFNELSLRFEMYHLHNELTICYYNSIDTNYFNDYIVYKMMYKIICDTIYRAKTKGLLLYLKPTNNYLMMSMYKMICDTIYRAKTKGLLLYLKPTNNYLIMSMYFHHNGNDNLSLSCYNSHLPDDCVCYCDLPYYLYLYAVWDNDNPSYNNECKMIIDDDECVYREKSLIHCYFVSFQVCGPATAIDDSVIPLADLIAAIENSLGTTSRWRCVIITSSVTVCTRKHTQRLEDTSRHILLYCYFDANQGHAFPSHITTCIFSAYVSMSNMSSDIAVCVVANERRLRMSLLTHRLCTFGGGPLAPLTSTAADYDPSRVCRLPRRRLYPHMTHLTSAYPFEIVNTNTVSLMLYVRVVIYIETTTCLNVRYILTFICYESIYDTTSANTFVMPMLFQTHRLGTAGDGFHAARVRPYTDIETDSMDGRRWRGVVIRTPYTVWDCLHLGHTYDSAVVVFDLCMVFYVKYTLCHYITYISLYISSVIFYFHVTICLYYKLYTFDDSYSSIISYGYNTSTLKQGKIICINEAFYDVEECLYLAEWMIYCHVVNPLFCVYSRIRECNTPGDSVTLTDKLSVRRTPETDLIPPGYSNGNSTPSIEDHTTTYQYDTNPVVSYNWTLVFLNVFMGTDDLILCTVQRIIVHYNNMSHKCEFFTTYPTYYHAVIGQHITHSGHHLSVSTTAHARVILSYACIFISDLILLVYIHG